MAQFRPVTAADLEYWRPPSRPTEWRASKRSAVHFADPVAVEFDEKAWGGRGGGKGAAAETVASRAKKAPKRAREKAGKCFDAMRMQASDIG
jgi:hypothetical protein